MTTTFPALESDKTYSAALATLEHALREEAAANEAHTTLFNLRETRDYDGNSLIYRHKDGHEISEGEFRNRRNNTLGDNGDLVYTKLSLLRLNAEKARAAAAGARQKVYTTRLAAVSRLTQEIEHHNEGYRRAVRDFLAYETARLDVPLKLYMMTREGWRHGFQLVPIPATAAAELDALATYVRAQLQRGVIDERDVPDGIRTLVEA